MGNKHRICTPSIRKKSPLVGTRCLDCKEIWFASEAGECPSCKSNNTQQKTAKFVCMNCEHKFVDYPGVVLPDPVHCPNSRCKEVSGKRHPGAPEERGTYIEWINYEEWVSKHK